jgi:hypothetical protein
MELGDVLSPSLDQSMVQSVAIGSNQGTPDLDDPDFVITD